jgi:hypothetical protein
MVAPVWNIFNTTIHFAAPVHSPHSIFLYKHFLFQGLHSDYHPTSVIWYQLKYKLRVAERTKFKRWRREMTHTIRQIRRTGAKRKCHKRHTEGQTRSNLNVWKSVTLLSNTSGGYDHTGDRIDSEGCRSRYWGNLSTVSHTVMSRNYFCISLWLQIKCEVIYYIKTELKWTGIIPMLSTRYISMHK